MQYLDSKSSRYQLTFSGRPNDTLQIVLVVRGLQTVLIDMGTGDA